MQAIVGLAFLALGLAFVLHGERRRRRWVQLQHPLYRWWEVLPKPMSVLVPTRLPDDQRDPETRFEQAGTVAELLSGAIAVVFGVVLLRLGS